MLTTDRFCPRCTAREGRSTVTQWTNEHDEQLTLACTGCGLVAGEPLTAGETRLLAEYADRPVQILRRPYEHV